MRARLVLLAAALLAFGASLGSGFHFDDYAISTISAKMLITTQVLRKRKEFAKSRATLLFRWLCESTSEITAQNA
jgi:hypothetical protein